MNTEETNPQAVCLSTALLGRHLDMYATLMDEAASLIETIPPDVFDAIRGRYTLCDELGGAAAMAKDDAKALRSTAESNGRASDPTRTPC